MKKVNSTIKILCISVALSLLVILPYTEAQAVDFMIANQITLTWDVTAPNNVGETIEYAVYIAPDGDKGSLTKLWQGPEVEYLVTLTTEGLFVFGLETYRMVDINGTPTAVSQAAIGWSDDPLVAPVPFGVQHYSPPAKGSGFKPK
jgi:hypothetical protein